VYRSIGCAACFLAVGLPSADANADPPFWFQFEWGYFHRHFTSPSSGGTRVDATADGVTLLPLGRFTFAIGRPPKHHESPPWSLAATGGVEGLLDQRGPTHHPDYRYLGLHAFIGPRVTVGSLGFGVELAGGLRMDHVETTRELEVRGRVEWWGGDRDEAGGGSLAVMWGRSLIDRSDTSLLVLIGLTLN
jgi:hypothetical protein